MNDLFMDFLTILLPTYFFFYMAITLIYRNRNSMINRVAAFLMLAFLFYFLGEYIKTSLLPQYQMQIVLYGNSPMLLFVICFLVHLSILIGSPVTSALNRWLPVIYASPFTLWLVFLFAKSPYELYNAAVTDGRSPLDPLFLLITIIFVAGYILISVLILGMSWRRTKEAKHKKTLRALLTSLFLLFAWFVLITSILQTGIIVTRNAMIFYFIGYLLWAAELRHLIGKHHIMPDYRKLFHILFHSAPTAILLLDQQGAVKESNPRAAQWFEGIPMEQLPSFFQFRDRSSLNEVLVRFAREGELASRWELQVHNPGKGKMDLMMGLERIEGSNEELFVIHLTDVTSLKETERRLMESERSYKHLAYHDSLTDLYNRAAIQERLQQKIKEEESFAIVLIDLDNFKPINDTYGHLVGDLYLKHVAGVFKAALQPGEHIGRIGGDEFVWIIPCTEQSRADQLVSDRLSELNLGPYKQQDLEIPLSFSAGASVYPTDGVEENTLLKKADEAMYRIKHAGKKGFSLYDRNAGKASN